MYQILKLHDVSKELFRMEGGKAKKGKKDVNKIIIVMPSPFVLDLEKVWKLSLTLLLMGRVFGNPSNFTAFGDP